MKRAVTIVNDLGLHMRAAGVLCRVATAFESSVTLIHGRQSANAKSIMSLLALGAPCGTELEVEIEGSDAEAAMAAVVESIETGFGE